MAITELRIYLEDTDAKKDGFPEVIIESYDNGEIQFASGVSSSKKNNIYDHVQGRVDADGDGDNDSEDDAIYIALVAAALKLLG